MGFQHNYPYGDVHELNLDWIIQTMQEFINSEREAGNTPTVSSVRSFFAHKYPYGDIHELNLDWVIQTALRMEEIGDSVEGDIGELQTRMTAAEGNISTLANTVSGLSDSVDQIESEIGNINDDVNALETTTAQHTTQIAALDAKIDSQVVANPAGAATDTLNKIEIAGTVYDVEGSGGSEVEANPAGEPTDTLETIGIDGTIYEVGGGSVEPVSKTATGNPIHIEDAADAPIVSGEVTFEPKQDLNGYDKPWAGGSGKNKENITLTSGTYSGVSWTVYDDKRIKISGTVPGGGVSLNTAIADLDTTALAGYKFVYSSEGSGTFYPRIMNSNLSANLQDLQNGTIIADNGSNCKLVYRIPNNASIDKTISSMIVPSTETDLSYAPYSNICPIEGYTDCELEVTGKNLLLLTIDTIKAANQSGTWTGNTYVYNNVTFTILTDSDNNITGIKVNGQASADTTLFITNRLLGTEFYLPAGTYTANGCPANGSNSTYLMWFQATRDGSLHSFGSDIGGGVTAEVLSTDRLQIVCFIKSGYSAQNLVFYPMIRLATETDPTFEPYKPSTTYTIDLDGTRYGGKVYPVTGKMSVGMGHIASYAGETIGEPWLSDRDEYVAGTTPSTGAEVVYTLASPTIVQLTPQQIRTLQGTNNISTNMTGMTVEYITQDYQPLVELIERSAGHHYSTQERVVGTYFGKPLYEKSFQVTTPSSNTSTNLVEVTDLNIDYMKNIGGTVKNVTTDNVGATSASGDFILWLRYNYENTGKAYIATQVKYSGYYRQTMYITMQYTKTTD